MTGPKAQDRMSPKAHRRTRRRTPRAGGCPERPADPGDCLLAGIDTALSALTSPAEPLPLDENAEYLRAALAHTAARGDTCRVAGAADNVRRAANLLLAGSPEQARQALRRARAGLVDER